VLCKPEHGRKILGGGTAGFSPQAAYIFLKQLEEAQLVVLNKIDRLSAGERDELLGLLRERFPAKRILAISAASGDGFAEFVSAIDAPAPTSDLTLDIDYDTYAQGEAALAWLNGSFEMQCDDSATNPWSMDTLVVQLVEQLSKKLLSAQVEPGHVKVLAWPTGWRPTLRSNSRSPPPQKCKRPMCWSTCAFTAIPTSLQNLFATYCTMWLQSSNSNTRSPPCSTSAQAGPSRCIATPRRRVSPLTDQSQGFRKARPWYCTSRSKRYLSRRPRRCRKFVSHRDDRFLRANLNRSRGVSKCGLGPGFQK